MSEKEVEEENDIHHSIEESIKHYGMNALLLFVPVYYLVHPDHLAIVIVDYFKIHPSVVPELIQYSAPAISGVLIGFFSIKILLLILLIFFLTFFFLSGIPVFLNWFVRIISGGKITNFLWINFQSISKVTRKIPEVKTLDKITRSTQSLIAGISILILYWMTLSGNTRWNYNSNKSILKSAEMHYYCQVTSGYNQKKCKDIKNLEN